MEKEAREKKIKWLIGAIKENSEAIEQHLQNVTWCGIANALSTAYIVKQQAIELHKLLQEKKEEEN